MQLLFGMQVSPAPAHCSASRTAAEQALSAGMLDDLHGLLQSDPDAQVVANCMSVLLEVCNQYDTFGLLHARHKQWLRALTMNMPLQTGSGQSLVTRALVISLLNRIKVSRDTAPMSMFV